MSRRNLLLLLTAIAPVLCAGFAGFNFAVGAWTDPVVRFAPAELRSVDVSSESRPTLTRGGFVMAAVDSSRRKLRAPQRPPTQSVILIGRFMVDGVARSDGLRPWSDSPRERALPVRPFLARGPPACKLA